MKLDGFFAIIHEMVDALYNWLDKIIGKRTRVQPKHFGKKGERAIDLRTSRRNKDRRLLPDPFRYTFPRLQSRDREPFI